MKIQYLWGNLKPGDNIKFSWLYYKVKKFDDFMWDLIGIKWNYSQKFPWPWYWRNKKEHNKVL